MTTKTLVLIVVLCEMAGNSAPPKCGAVLNIDTFAANPEGNGHYHMTACGSAQTVVMSSGKAIQVTIT
jgi:hypothetical protein